MPLRCRLPQQVILWLGITIMILFAIKLAISNFIKYCHVTVVDRSTVETSVASAFADFEDGMQNACAMECKADYIVTRNVDDFTTSSLNVVEPSQFLQALIS